MAPEHLVGTAQLSQWYKFGLTEGDYKHRATANVKVSNVGSSSTVLLTPSLLDLLNDNNIAPQDVDREALEKAIFDRHDPYDLDETDRVDAAISGVPRVQRSSTHWAPPFPLIDGSSPDVEMADETAASGSQPVLSNTVLTSAKEDRERERAERKKNGNQHGKGKKKTGHTIFERMH
ncbi:hypothetical protein B0H10DRAFT_2438074 [Mycena sp. CBHHK59/15]|nr:hypothetical protein B0H10DRAFT_2438074 [Mycena sp. CBHHK59/15]